MMYQGTLYLYTDTPVNTLTSPQHRTHFNTSTCNISTHISPHKHSPTHTLTHTHTPHIHSPIHTSPHTYTPLHTNLTHTSHTPSLPHTHTPLHINPPLTEFILSPLLFARGPAMSAMRSGDLSYLRLLPYIVVLH